MTAFESMSSSGGSQGMSSDLENMLQMVQSDATDALRTQSANAIGRLHQVLSQFVEMAAGPMGAMVRIPELFLHSIEQFVLAKLQASKTMHISFIESFHKLVCLFNIVTVMCNCDTVMQSNHEKIMCYLMSCS